MSAHAIAIVRFEQEWTPLGDSGAAVMPTGGLHALARRKRWEWATDEITDRLAARAEDVAAAGAEPVPAYALGHDLGPDRTDRPQAVVGNVVRGVDDGRLWWNGTVPVGCVGAPAFVDVPLGDQRFKPVCVGVVLPAVDTRHPVAAFVRRDPFRREGAARSVVLHDTRNSGTCLRKVVETGEVTARTLPERARPAPALAACAGSGPASRTVEGRTSRTVEGRTGPPDGCVRPSRPSGRSHPRPSPRTAGPCPP